MINYLKNITLVIGAVLALIQLYQIGGNILSVDLVATVHQGIFSLPPDITNIFSDKFIILEKSEADSIILNKLKQKTLYDYEIKRMTRELDQKHIFNKLYDPINSLRSFKAYWNIEIINEGSKSLTNVSIKFPDTEYFFVTKDEKGEVYRNHTGLLRLGTMQPKERVNIFVWKDSYKYYLSNDDFILSHDNGVGSVSIFRPTGKLGFWIENNIFFVVYIILMILLVFTAFFFYLSEKYVIVGKSEK
jgi:hypothetical protein